MGEGKIFGPLDIEISPKDVAMREFDIKPLRPPVLNSSMSVETSVHFSTPSCGGGVAQACTYHSFSHALSVGNEWFAVRTK